MRTANQGDECSGTGMLCNLRRHVSRSKAKQGQTINQSEKRRSFFLLRGSQDGKPLRAAHRRAVILTFGGYIRKAHLLHQVCQLRADILFLVNLARFCIDLCPPDSDMLFRFISLPPFRDCNSIARFPLFVSPFFGTGFSARRAVAAACSAALFPAQSKERRRSDRQ